MDDINISLATIKGRKEQLEKTVSSLLNQGDKINIFFNGFKKPEIDSSILNYPCEIEYQVRKVNIGDQGKFYWSYEKGYHIICDDDIIYPQDYVFKMIEAVEKYNRKAIITLHGKQFKPAPILNYYTHCSARPHCRFDLDKDTFVHCPGTGVMAYHSSLFKPQSKDFRSANMADLWIGILAQKKKIPCIAIAHRGDWIKVQEVKNTIFSKEHVKPQRITKLANSIKWKLHKM